MNEKTNPLGELSTHVLVGSGQDHAADHEKDCKIVKVVVVYLGSQVGLSQELLFAQKPCDPVDPLPLSSDFVNSYEEDLIDEDQLPFVDVRPDEKKKEVFRLWGASLRQWSSHGNQRSLLRESDLVVFLYRMDTLMQSASELMEGMEVFVSLVRGRAIKYVRRFPLIFLEYYPFPQIDPILLHSPSMGSLFDSLPDELVIYIASYLDTTMPFLITCKRFLKLAKERQLFRVSKSQEFISQAKTRFDASHLVINQLSLSSCFPSMAEQYHILHKKYPEKPGYVLESFCHKVKRKFPIFYILVALLICFLGNSVMFGFGLACLPSEECQVTGIVLFVLSTLFGICLVFSCVVMNVMWSIEGIGVRGKYRTSWFLPRQYSGFF